VTFLLLPNWERLNRDVWTSLEKLVSTPDDMYTQLLSYRLSLFEKPKQELELKKPETIEALNNPDKARDVFLSFPLPENEERALSVIRGYYDVLRQFPTDVSEKFRERIADWIADHNLRYTVTQDCRLRLTIQGLLMTQIGFLRAHITNPDTLDALDELENSLSNLDGSDQVKNCLRAASNLLEGVMSDKTGLQSSDFNEALNRCHDLFPHKSLKDSLGKIYNFFCDYPNIRHRGNSASRVRNLKRDDALLMTALISGMATFIVDDNSSERILRGEP
jgi:hypothetical protein